MEEDPPHTHLSGLRGCDTAHGTPQPMLIMASPLFRETWDLAARLLLELRNVPHGDGISLRVLLWAPSAVFLTLTHTLVHSHTHTFTCSLTHTQCSHTHTQFSHSHAHTHTHTIQTHTVCSHTYAPMLTHTQVLTHMLTFAHSHSHMHTQGLSSPSGSLCSLALILKDELEAEK